MKKVLLLFGMLMVISLAAFAQAPAVAAPLDPVFVPPEWLQSLVLLIQGMPIAGPYVALILKWLTVILAVVTAVTHCVNAVIASLQGITNYAGLQSVNALVTSLEQSKAMSILRWAAGFSSPAPAANPPPPPA